MPQKHLLQSNPLEINSSKMQCQTILWHKILDNMREISPPALSLYVSIFLVCLVVCFLSYNSQVHPTLGEMAAHATISKHFLRQMNVRKKWFWWSKPLRLPRVWLYKWRQWRHDLDLIPKVSLHPVTYSPVNNSLGTDLLRRKDNWLTLLVRREGWNRAMLQHNTAHTTAMHMQCSPLEQTLMSYHNANTHALQDHNTQIQFFF